jgi:mannose-6-phosphate isomerase-like protein (cupin superfamily)
LEEILSFEVLNVDEHPWDTTWRPGVSTRNWSAEIDGARELHLGEQIFEPGKGVPNHWHTYEEHLMIMSGQMELVVDGETRVIGAPGCVVIHKHTVHSFIAVGEVPLHIYGVISSPIHETYFADFAPGEAVRQYEADFPDGARRRVRHVGVDVIETIS